MAMMGLKRKQVLLAEQTFSRKYSIEDHHRKIQIQNKNPDMTWPDDIVGGFVYFTMGELKNKQNEKDFHLKFEGMADSKKDTDITGVIFDMLFDLRCVKFIIERVFAEYAIPYDYDEEFGFLVHWGLCEDMWIKWRDLNYADSISAIDFAGLIANIFEVSFLHKKKNDSDEMVYSVSVDSPRWMRELITKVIMEGDYGSMFYQDILGKMMTDISRGNFPEEYSH